MEQFKLKKKRLYGEKTPFYGENGKMKIFSHYNDLIENSIFS